MQDSAYRVRAIRGATTMAQDDAVGICEATSELLQTILHENQIEVSQIISAFFTVTPDLRSEFPARAARDLGWGNVPMMCAVEVDVPGALARCVRVLLHVEVTGREQVRHVYLRGAEGLRPDL